MMAIDGDLNVQTNVMNLHTIMSDDKHLIDINGAADHINYVNGWSAELWKRSPHSIFQ